MRGGYGELFHLLGKILLPPCGGILARTEGLNAVQCSRCRALSSRVDADRLKGSSFRARVSPIDQISA